MWLLAQLQIAANLINPCPAEYSPENCLGQIQYLRHSSIFPFILTMYPPTSSLHHCIQTKPQIGVFVSNLDWSKLAFAPSFAFFQYHDWRFVVIFPVARKFLLTCRF